MFRSGLWLLLILLFLPSVAGADALEPDALIERMQAGGLVIYWRHAATDRSRRDRDLSDMSRCELQRNLDDGGREQARRVGEGFERHAIPVERILSSAFCRNIDTARIAFGEDSWDVRDDLFNVPPVRDRQRQQALVGALRDYLVTPPEDGAKNVVIVGHNINLQRAARVRIDEGEIAVFEPGGDRPRVMGVLTPADFD
ncbi:MULTISPECIES: histidine phosphatase family protein [unclassified Thioalkalivibrio]|uniref:histidine phosphatase family protein n=1 Tax=unclassified Thioalkalivibrio TaxID=2621013 RepID=UPI000372C243|nr:MULTISPECIES: histidine phosphatase family protein [unclassified Thioalkalivibrio]